MNENFSNQIKKELCTKLTDRDKKYACLYGLLLFSHRFSYNGDTSFRTECLELAEIFPKLVKNLSKNISVDCIEKVLQNDDKSYTFKFSSSDYNSIIDEFNIQSTHQIDQD